MTTSASTPRIRFTQLSLVAVVAAVAFSGGRALEGPAGLVAQATGALLVIAGTLWRLWASAFVAGRKDTEVVADGPYAACRHPLYLGSLCAGLGIGLATRSVVLSALIPAMLFIAFGAAIRREERYLAGRHGDTWDRYRRAVPRLLPRLGRTTVPDRRSVDLPVYRKAFLDAASMLTLLVLVLTVDALRGLGLWRAPFVLP